MPRRDLNQSHSTTSMASRLDRLLRSRNGPQIWEWLQSLPNADDWDEWQDFWVYTRRGRPRRYCNICGFIVSLSGCTHDFVMRYLFSTNRVLEHLELITQDPICPILRFEVDQAISDAKESHQRNYRTLLTVRRREVLYEWARGDQSKPFEDSLTFVRSYRAELEHMYGLRDSRQQLVAAVGRFLRYAVFVNWCTEELAPWVDDVMDQTPPGLHPMPKSVEEVGLKREEVSEAIMTRLRWRHDGCSRRTGNPRLSRWLDNRYSTKIHTKTMFWIPGAQLKELIVHAIETFHWSGASNFVIVTSREPVRRDSSIVIVPEWTVFPVYDELL